MNKYYIYVCNVCAYLPYIMTNGGQTMDKSMFQTSLAQIRQPLRHERLLSLGREIRTRNCNTAVGCTRQPTAPYIALPRVPSSTDRFSLYAVIRTTCSIQLPRYLLCPKFHWRSKPFSGKESCDLR